MKYILLVINTCLIFLCGAQVQAELINKTDQEAVFAITYYYEDGKERGFRSPEVSAGGNRDIAGYNRWINAYFFKAVANIPSLRLIDIPCLLDGKSIIKIDHSIPATHDYFDIEIVPGTAWYDVSCKILVPGSKVRD